MLEELLGNIASGIYDELEMSPLEQPVPPTLKSLKPTLGEAKEYIQLLGTYNVDYANYSNSANKLKLENLERKQQFQKDISTVLSVKHGFEESALSWVLLRNIVAMGEKYTSGTKGLFEFVDKFLEIVHA